MGWQRSNAIAKEYLQASSPRREQIEDHLREMGIDGAGAAQVAAHRTRDSKELLSPEEERFQRTASWPRSMDIRPTWLWPRRGSAASARNVDEPDRIAEQAVTYARDHLFERSAVLDRREILEAALNRGMGETTYTHVRAGVRAAGRARRVPHGRSCRSGTAVHDRRDGPHGTRDRCTDAGGESAWSQ